MRLVLFSFLLASGLCAQQATPLAENPQKQYHIPKASEAALQESSSHEPPWKPIRIIQRIYFGSIFGVKLFFIPAQDGKRGTLVYIEKSDRNAYTESK